MRSQRMIERRFGIRALLVILVASFLPACASEDSEPDAFEAAMETCGVGEDPADVRIEDGTELRINNQGDQDNSGIPLDDVWCLLDSLDMPDDIADRMVATSGNDGEQTAAWDEYSVVWTYHPNRGLDVFVTR